MSQASTAVEWVRPPQQTRSEESLERMLDAAEEIVAKKGFEQATVAEIVQRAKSSVGAFYGRFREKNALLGCLHDRFCAEAIATADDALNSTRWQGASITEILSETLPFLVNVYRQRRTLFRAFMVRAFADPDFAGRSVELNDYLLSAMGELLFERRAQIGHPSPHEAIETGFQMVLSMLDQAVLYDEIDRRGMKLDDPRLAGELVRMYLGYLDVEPSWPANGEYKPDRKGEIV